MKYYLLVALLVLGCKANVAEPNSAANVPEQETPGEGRPIDHEDPGAGKPSLGQCADSAGHYVWNKTKNAYDYVTSEEAKKAYSETWEKAKAAAKDAYDGAVKSYDEYQAESKKEESSETP